MKVVKETPPNYEEICKVFDIRGSKSIVFTYGDTIYNPGGGKISKHLLVHEKVHIKQQGDNPAGWWDRYLVDKKFRLDQEVEAYRKQWRHILRNNHNLKERAFLLNKIAGDLSGPIYGNVVGMGEAVELIMKND